MKERDGKHDAPWPEGVDRERFGLLYGEVVELLGIVDRLSRRDLAQVIVESPDPDAPNGIRRFRPWRFADSGEDFKITNSVEPVTFTIEVRGQSGCICIGPEWSGWMHRTTYATLDEAKVAALEEKRSHDWAVRVVGSDGTRISIARQRKTIPNGPEPPKEVLRRYSARKRKEAERAEDARRRAAKERT